MVVVYPKRLTRDWLVAIVGGTAIAFFDYALSRLYGASALVEASLVGAGLSAVLLSACGLLMAISLGVWFLGRLGKTAPSFASLALSVVAICFCINVMALDYRNGAFGSTRLGAAKWPMALTAVGLLALSCAYLRPRLTRGRLERLASVLSAQNALIAIALTLAVWYTITSKAPLSREAEGWGYAAMQTFAAALIATGFVGVLGRRLTWLRSICVTAGCIGLIALPLWADPARGHGYRDSSEWARAPRHVLLITVDTLRRDALSSMGSTLHQTPFIDELAAESVVFSSAIAPSTWTIPSIISVLTGVSPLVHRVEMMNDAMDTSLTTLAEVFRRHGYHTGALGESPHFHPGTRNVEQGFEAYRWFPRLEYEHTSIGVAVVRRLFPEVWPEVASARGLTDQAIRWYGRHEEKRTFLWVHYLDPHLPYAPPQEYRGDNPGGGERALKTYEPTPQQLGMMQLRDRPSDRRVRAIRDIYLAEVRYVDDSIGRLMTYLREAGLFEDALIVFTSDHGEEFWDHGGYMHGHSMHREVINVPLMLKLPGQQGGTVADTPVSTSDILPTLLDLCGFPADSAAGEGASLRSHWDADGPAALGEPVVSAFTFFGGDQRAVTLGDFKLIDFVEEDRQELYSLLDDPDEQRDLAPSDPETVSVMRKAISAAEARAASTRSRLGLATSSASLSPDVVDLLESLGYIQ